jgi:serine/threonine protein kinase/formylglycine-generating enzyme required for sulfatase activity
MVQSKNYGPKRIGEFQLIRELGRGGMGIVFEAIQDSLRRKVALKILPSQLSMDMSALARFQREAAAAGRLQHEAIASVYTIGEENGIHYFAMEMVEGPSLEDCLKKVRSNNPAEMQKSLLEEAGFFCPDWVPASPMPRFYAAAASWCARIADALFEAHRERILHRDLKPSNILIRPDGSPVLVDFGLSRDQMEGGLTRSGDAVGTPSYMAPEQARGESNLDQRVDVYGLGAALYELVTFRPPFEGKHPSQIMKKILEEDPVDPCKLNSSLPRDLAKIIMRCLEKEKGRRYTDAKSLAQELWAFVRGKAIATKGPSVTDKTLKKFRRNGKLILSSLLGAVAVSLLGVGLIGGRAYLARKGGEEQLEAALASLESEDGGAASSALVQARKALGDEVVKGAWVSTLKKKIDLLYAKKRFAACQKLLDATAGHFSKEQVLQELRQRVQGRGDLQLEFHPGFAKVHLVPVSAKGVLGGEFSYVAGKPLPMGVYLVRVRAKGYVEGSIVVRVLRDKLQKAFVWALPRGKLRPGTAFCGGASLQKVPPFLIQKDEVRGRAYAEFLASLSDPFLKIAFRPLSWDGDRCPKGAEDRPVGGVSLQGALAFAKWLGGHLPTKKEFLLAGNLGLPWIFPWGMKNEPSRVVHNPGGGSDLEALENPDRGASRIGCRDLVGSLSEWVLDPQKGPSLMGGDYRWPEEEISLLTMERPLNLRPAPWGGFRVAFYIQGDSPASIEPSDSWKKWEQNLEIGLPQAWTEFQLSSDGWTSWMNRVSGSLDQFGGQRIKIPLQGGLRDFADARPPLILKPTKGTPIVLAGSNSSQSWLAFQPKRGEKTFEIEIKRTPVPKRILEERFGIFSHRFRFSVYPSMSHTHVLYLPRKSRILEMDPSPTETRIEGESRVFYFHFEARPTSVPREESVDVLFVLDGQRGPEMPGISQGLEAVQGFAQAWRNREIEMGLEKWIHPTAFTFGMEGRSWNELRPWVRRMPPDLGTNLKIRGTRILGQFGLTLAIEVQNGEKNFSQRFTLAATTGSWKVIDVHPKGNSDQGHISGKGYFAPKLKLKAGPFPGFRPKRLVGFGSQAQVAFLPLRKTIVETTGKNVEIGFRLFVLGMDLGLDPSSRPDRDRFLHQRIQQALAGRYDNYKVQRTSLGSVHAGPLRGAFISRWTIERAWSTTRPPENRIAQVYILLRGRRLLLVLGEGRAKHAKVLSFSFEKKFRRLCERFIQTLRF